jgi:hypothetical protein
MVQYRDNQGRTISQTAYNAQQRAGIDVSWYTQISTTPTQTNTNPATFSPNQATGNYQAPTNYQTNPNIPWQAQTDFSQTNPSAINPSGFKYGQDAITGWVNQQDRNLQLWSYYAGIGAKSYQDIYNDLSKIQSYASMDEAAKQRTAQDIYQKMWQYQAQQETPEDKMLANLKKELNIANLRGEWDISEFLRTAYANQQTIDKGREKFTNRDEIQRKVQWVIDAIARNKMLQAGKGIQPWTAPTESDIQAAMDATGATREEIMKIAAGQGYEWLQRDPKYSKENLTLNFDRSVDDATLQKQRDLEDMTTQLNNTKQNLNRQIQDIVEQVQQNTAAAEKIWALKWFNRSSGYLDWIIAMQTEGNKLVDRLQTQIQQAEAADIKVRGRLLEDFNRNLDRAKFDLDKQMDDLKTKTAVELWSMQSKYSLGSPQMDVAISDLMEQSLNYSNTAYMNYTNAMRNNIAAKQDELNLIEAQDNQFLKKISNFTTAITANNWAALMNMTTTQLAKYQEQGMSADQVKNFRDAMVNKTLASFSNLNLKDIENVKKLIDSGKTPQEVITWLQAQGKNYIGTSTAGTANDWKPDANNPWYFYRTGSDGQLEYTNNPTMETTTQWWVEYTPVDQSTLNNSVMEVLTQKKDWTSWGQCGSFVNDYLESMWLWRMFVDPIDSKKAVMNSTKPKVWSIVVMNSPTKPQYGHVAIVTKVNNDWTIEIKNSNWSWDGKVSTNTIKAANVLWYFDPTKAWAQSTQKQDTEVQLTSSDYYRFNNSTFKPQDIKTPEDKAKFSAFLQEKERVFNDPEASAEDIFRVSAWWWDLSDTSLQKLDKFSTVLSWLWEISKSIKKANTWPIVWIFSSKNPYDTNAQALKAQLIAIIPNLARWVYWEVWVLTDNDIRLYQQTVPNLRQTSQVQKAVLAMTLKTVQRGMENSLKTQARAGKDVSLFIWELRNIQNQVAAIEAELWIWASTTTTQWWTSAASKGRVR